ncbi:MAG: biotin--[acetyl-CoA-carboxylase] ligase, partial [Pseudomonadota bacterium]|nr:biotin--[acetyl-CoA-carboxylase] ligase [Pseudomonadota bacterium]
MNTIVVKLLAQLSDGRFHSGERIAHNLGVSRTTVWELVRNLESMGLTIFSSRGHGYCLAEPVDMLDRIKLKDLLPKNYFYPVEIIDCLESTNTTLMLMADKAECGTAVVAEIQTAGRGRLGRTWLAAPGLSLTFSMLWRFEAGVLALEGLSLVVGLACVTALRKLGYDDIWLKWPNDLLYGEKKVGGILIETQGDVHGPIHTVIGVGININVPVGWPKLLGREIGGLALQGVR